MIINSIRLKNIKSYGAGPDGDGVVVSFQPGVNRISGRNGHGKSTLIEALGYALFLTEPQFEENFQIERYFLSNGSKEGEIDVTFTHNGETFHVERGIGRQSRRVSKVVQISDGSICAEKDDQVSRFLCDVLNIPEPNRLREMFSKLIGVKQGRLAWPFDSKPSEAKKFFEPLLDVAVFRACFDQLKPAVDIFKAQGDEQQMKAEGLKARIDERANSESEFKICQQSVVNAGKKVSQDTETLAQALKLKTELEKLQQTADAAKLKADGCRQSLDHAIRFRQAMEQEVTQAQAAAERMKDRKAAFIAFEEAEKALAGLEIKRSKRDQLVKARGESEAIRLRNHEQGEASRKRAAIFSEQKDTKLKARTLARAELEPRATEALKTKSAFEQRRDSTERAKKEMAVIGDWLPRLEEHAKTQAERFDRILSLEKEISTWDNNKLAVAQHEESTTRQAHDGTREELAQAKERLNTLREQLKQISGGVCPFLKERCAQFDPAKITADVSACETTIDQLQSREAAAKTAFEKAKAELAHIQSVSRVVEQRAAESKKLLIEYARGATNLVPGKVTDSAAWLSAWESRFGSLPEARQETVSTSDQLAKSAADFTSWLEQVRDWWSSAKQGCDQKLRDFIAEEQARARAADSIRNFSERIAELTKEVEELTRKVDLCLSEAESQEKAVKTAAEQIVTYDQQLTPFAGLDSEIIAAKSVRDANRPGHQEYLTAKGLAEQLEARQTKLTSSQKDEQTAREKLDAALAEEQTAHKAFDPAKLKAAVEDHQSKYDSLQRSKFAHAQSEKELSQAKRRFEEWQEFSRQGALVAKEVGRLKAAVELTEAARRTLRDTAPEVARHICAHIAKGAQRLFNQINPEPIELEWDSDHYSLQVAPGDRRFAMLSGGEQTKLALAMTLAMIEEFSALRFCVFDEPTYGVDAESRRKLADAILEAQKAAELEQLLLVSHDDAFEGKIENSIVLNKHSSSGTAALQI